MNLIVDIVGLFKLYIHSEEVVKLFYQSSMTVTSGMSRRIYYLLTFILWIITLVECSSTTSITTIACPDTQQVCGNKFCYDPATQFCSETGSVVTCINACGQKCYDSASQICINSTVCGIGGDVCEVKYDNYTGNSIEPPQLQCYKPWSQRCLNHTICYQKDRVCNGQCILYTASYQRQVCANDNVTLCTVQNIYTYYQPNQIQVCNGSCYDTEMGLTHCVNDSVQCVSNCSNVCYSATIHICANGTICSFGQDACLTNYSSSDGYPLASQQLECYYPWSSKCIDGALCSNGRICNGQCITGYTADKQVCANDKRTLCNVTHYNNYRPYQMHICNGKCFDTSLQQCINGVVSCIDDICGDQCYNSAVDVCLNSTLCPVGTDLCEVKFHTNSGNSIEPPQLKCYDPRSRSCLNHTICYEKDRVCNGQCILYTTPYQYQVCANDNVTLCNVFQPYNKYKPNQIQVCNGSCYDTGYPLLKHCRNGSAQCISNCSNACYNASTHACINGTICGLTENLCQTYYGRVCYNPLQDQCLNDTLCPIAYDRCYTGQCYEPVSKKCLNGIVCSNARACGGKCINNDYQVCANDQQTVCNVTEHYTNYRLNRILLCLGVCYDSALQQCSGEHVVLCIHDPDTQQCVPQKINSSTTITPSPSTINNIFF